MTHERPDSASAEVISMDAFRKQLSPKLEIDTPTSGVVNGYNFVDDPTFQAVRRVYDVLGDSESPEALGVFAQPVGDNPHNVLIAHDEEGGEYFAVERNRDEIETLLVDLDVNDDTDRQVLRDPLLRFYTATLIARTLLKVRHPIRNFSHDIPKPKIGSEVYSIAPTEIWHPNQEWFDITRWRVASGVGLLAVTYKRQGLRTKMKEYLNERLDNHFQYMLAISRAEDLFGINLPDEEDGLRQMLVGMCNPIDSRFDIKKLIEENKSNPELADVKVFP